MRNHWLSASFSIAPSGVGQTAPLGFSSTLETVMAYADRFFADGTVEPAGYVQLSPSTAIGIGIGAGRLALIQVLDQNVRYRDDGTDPTTTTGVRIHAGESIWYTGDLRALRFIEESASAEINVLVYK